MFNVSILCKQSMTSFQQKLWYKLISPHIHYLFINKMQKDLQRAITLTKLAPSPLLCSVCPFLSSNILHPEKYRVFSECLICKCVDGTSCPIVSSMESAIDRIMPNLMLVCRSGIQILITRFHDVKIPNTQMSRLVTNPTYWHVRPANT